MALHPSIPPGLSARDFPSCNRLCTCLWPNFSNALRDCESSRPRSTPPQPQQPSPLPALAVRHDTMLFVSELFFVFRLLIVLSHGYFLYEYVMYNQKLLRRRRKRAQYSPARMWVREAPIYHVHKIRVIA
jgi:hypothetical protein